MDEQQLRRAIRDEIEAERRAQQTELNRYLSRMLYLGAVLTLVMGGVLLAVFVPPALRLFGGDVQPILPMVALVGSPFALVALLMVLGAARSRRG